jgi:hypothetical protein
MLLSNCPEDLGIPIVRTPTIRVLLPRILVFYGDGRLMDNVPLPITPCATTVTTTATKITRGTTIIATIGAVIATGITTSTAIA